DARGLYWGRCCGTRCRPHLSVGGQRHRRLHPRARPLLRCLRSQADAQRGAHAWAHSTAARQSSRPACVSACGPTPGGQCQCLACGLRGVLLFGIAFATLTGLPATPAPVALPRTGLPVGLQIIAPYLEDATPIDLAGKLADVLGGFRPPQGYCRAPP